MGRVVRETTNWLYKLLGLAIALILLGLLALGALAAVGALGVM